MIYMSYDSLAQEHGGVDADGSGTGERGRGRRGGAPGTTVADRSRHYSLICLASSLFLCVFGS